MTHFLINFKKQEPEFRYAGPESPGTRGQNGAVKSTRLKISTGMVIPGNGVIRIDGKIAEVHEIGTGFSMADSRFLKIFMKAGILIGMTWNKIDPKNQALIHFSEPGSS